MSLITPKTWTVKNKFSKIHWNLNNFSERSKYIKTCSMLTDWKTYYDINFLQTDLYIQCKLSQIPSSVPYRNYQTNSKFYIEN